MYLVNIKLVTEGEKTSFPMQKMTAIFCRVWASGCMFLLVLWYWNFSKIPVNFTVILCTTWWEVIKHLFHTFRPVISWERWVTTCLELCSPFSLLPEVIRFYPFSKKCSVNDPCSIAVLNDFSDVLKMQRFLTLASFHVSNRCSGGADVMHLCICGH